MEQPVLFLVSFGHNRQVAVMKGCVFFSYYCRFLIILLTSILKYFGFKIHMYIILQFR